MLRIYVLVTLALIVLILVVSSSPDWDGPARWWAGVSGLVIAVGLYIATNRDLQSSLAYIGIVLLCLGTIMAPLSHGLLAVGWGAGIGLLAYSYYLRSRPESPDFPDIILRHVPDRKWICERDDVQVGASWSLSEEEDLTYLVVYLQNCMDAPREVTVRIRSLGWWSTPWVERPPGSWLPASFSGAKALNRPPLRLPWRSSGREVRFPTRCEAVLGPAEVGCLRIPVQGTAGSDWSLNLSTSISGGGGKRIRHRKAPELSRLFPAWASVWFGTGGLWVSFPGCSYAGAWPQPTWELLWQPQWSGSSSSIARLSQATS